MLSGEERRQFRRVALRLPISLLDVRQAECNPTDLWTSNVSAAGTYLEAYEANAPVHGEEVAFELTIPPGDGYSASLGRIRGIGKVVRRTRLGEGALGVALHFTQPLALDFQ